MIVNQTRRLRRWPVVFVVAAGLCRGAKRGRRRGWRTDHAGVGRGDGDRVAPGWLGGDRAAGTDRAAAGAGAYATLDRYVHVTTFVLEKNGQRKRCMLAYDSQLDTIAEECRDAE